jgi:hypothetical protein
MQPADEKLEDVLKGKMQQYHHLKRRSRKPSGFKIVKDC